jgi:sugar lactone lactonase YvrE
VTLSGLHAPRGLRFDAQGALLVADSSSAVLFEYSGISLTVSGPPTDTISMSGITAAGATWSPIGLALDHQGNVWVSAVPRVLPPAPASASVPAFIIAEFTPAALQGGGAPAPVLTLVQTGASLPGYGPGMAFDSAGDLWTANANGGSLTKFAAALLVAGANPAPSITITGATLFGVSDIVIDPADILHVGGNAYGSPGAGIFMYRLSQLTASGSPSPVFSFTPAKGLNHFAIR